MVRRSPSTGVPKDSHLRDLGQSPFPSPVPTVQEAPAAINEEETASMRELVEQIDAHAESEEMEATSPLKFDMVVFYIFY